MDAPFCFSIPLLRHLLLLGATGPSHLRQTARRAAREASAGAGRSVLLHLAGDLLALAICDDPLDPSLAREMLTLKESAPEAAPAIPGSILSAVAAVEAPEEVAYLDRLVAKRDMAKLRTFIEKRVTGGNPIFWLRAGFNAALREGDPEFGEFLVRNHLPDAIGGLSSLLRAETAMAAAEHERAAELFAEAARVLDLPYLGRKRAQALLAMGEREAATALLVEMAGRFPWHVGLTGRLHDLALGVDAERAAIPSGVRIFCYTFNKAAALDAMLASLAESEIGDARIVVLDNASSDATPDVLCAWGERLGSERLTAESLPVNIGAPAARNWLMAKYAPESRWVVYLDDDVILPPDWLSGLFAAEARHPQAGAYGCKIVDASAERIVQGADIGLLPLKPRAEAVGYFSHTDVTPPLQILPTDLHMQSFDAGQFDYMRPCLSVMGCCHLFSTAILARHGGFDIQYSPSQFDDLDHDLWLALAGHPPVYTGHVAVQHLRTAPVFEREGRESLYLREANMLKLRARFDHHVEDLFRIQDELLWKDYVGKRLALRERGIIES
jgi:GT2 family glycosyltransferase